MIAGRLSKSNVNVLLTGNVIKRQLRLPLTAGGAGGRGSAERRQGGSISWLPELLPPMPGEMVRVGIERRITRAAESSARDNRPAVSDRGCLPRSGRGDQDREVVRDRPEPVIKQPMGVLAKAMPFRTSLFRESAN